MRGIQHRPAGRPEVLTRRETVCIRPAWQTGSPVLSDRARELLIREWRELGLLPGFDVEENTEEILAGVQRRGTVTELRRTEHPAVVVKADVDGPAREAPSAEFTGVLMKHGEVAVIGRDADGRLVRERFTAGAVRMPDGPAPLVNVGHDRARLVGHLVRVWDEGGAVMCRGVVADRTHDGHDAMELAQLGTLSRLSVEFLPARPRVTTAPEGGRMVEHSSCVLVGVGLVPAGAYESARITRLLDRSEAGRQRDSERRRALAELTEAQVRARRSDEARRARQHAHELLAR